MSGLLAGKVWQSNLEAHLKPLAAAMADIANDDGTKIFPSVAYLGWLLGRDDRSVQRGLNSLKTLGVLEIVAFEKGGRNHTTQYHLIESALPSRPPWNEVRKGDTMPPFTNLKGDTSVAERVTPATERVTPVSQRVTPVSPDPSVTVIEPLEEPSSKPLSPAERIFVCWKEAMGKTKARLDTKRRDLINRRLADGYTVDDLCIAVRGCAESPFHMGKNDRNTKYDDIMLICRDAKHVDQFLEIAQGENGNGYRLRSGLNSADLDRMGI